MAKAIEIEIDGIKALQAKLKELPDRVQKKLMRKAARVTAKEVQQSAKTYVPIDSGDLHDAISVRAFRRSRKNKGTVGVRVQSSRDNSQFRGETFYGAFQEFGTQFIQPPNDFLGPAYEENRTSGEARFVRALQQAIKDEEQKKK